MGYRKPARRTCRIRRVNAYHSDQTGRAADIGSGRLSDPPFHASRDGADLGAVREHARHPENKVTFGGGVGMETPRCNVEPGRQRICFGSFLPLVPERDVEQGPRVALPPRMEPDPARPHPEPASTPSVAPKPPSVDLAGPHVDDEGQGSGEWMRDRQPIAMPSPPRPWILNRLKG